MKIANDPPAPPAETSHPSHPGHALRLVTTDDVFICDGCKERGAGTRYTCEQHDCEDKPCCDFDLHTWCALAPDVLEHHLLEGCAFKLLPKPPSPANHRVCDACSDAVRGFVYHCFDCDRDLHPCCARLPGRIALDGLDFELCDKSAACRGCGVCAGEKGQRCLRKFWSYRSDCDGEAVFLHVACMKKVANEGLKASGHRTRYGGCRGDKIVQVDAPVLKMVLKKRARTNSKVKRFLKIAAIVIRVIIGLVLGDPTAMIAAVFGLVVNNG